MLSLTNESLEPTSQNGGLRLGIALQVGHWNPGDALPTYSARAILDRALDPLSLDSWFLHEAAPLSLPGFQFLPYDLAAVLCTPWIWDQGQESPKYEILRNFLCSTDAPKRIGVGIGSSFLLHHLGIGETIPGQTAIRKCSREWQKFDLVVCRDRLAATLFEQILPTEKVVLHPCPSFYSAEVFGVRPQPQFGSLLAYAEITNENYWGSLDDHLAAACRFQDDLIQSGITVMTMMDRDREAFAARYGRPPDIDVRAPSDILSAIAQFQSLTSPRVHACMPALSLGLETEIVPLDSRALTAIGLGAKPVAVPLNLMESFLEPITPVSLDDYAATVKQAVFLK